MTVLEMEAQTRQVCQELAEIKNQPIAASPDDIRALYARLNECQRALDKLVGSARADKIVTDIYNEIVKSK